LERFCTTLDCVDVNFIPDSIVDQPPLPAVSNLQGECVVPIGSMRRGRLQNSTW